MKKLLHLIMLLLLIAPVVSLGAKGGGGKGNDVDCNVDTLQSAIDKLDKSIANSLDVFGNCIEDIVITGFADLTLTGHEGASLTATSFIAEDPERNSTIALYVEHSKITVQTLTINGGSDAVYCLTRSTCDFRDVIIQRGHKGLTYTMQSTGNILGSTMILGPTVPVVSGHGFITGLGIFNESSVNIRTDDSLPWPAGPAAVISGYSGNAGIGAMVLDGSFLRTDDATFSGNGTGIYAHRNAVIKIYGADGGVMDNELEGIWADQLTSAAIATPVTGNGGAGIFVGPLTSFQDQGITFSGNNGGGPDVVCNHPTAISSPPHWCGN